MLNLEGVWPVSRALDAGLSWMAGPLALWILVAAVAVLAADVSWDRRQRTHVRRIPDASAPQAREG